MEAKKIFSKLNMKNYNNILEEILEEKLFSLDVKNILLSMLYKSENAYKDYKTVKVEVLPEKEFISYIVKTIKERCFGIEFISPEEKENKEKINKRTGEITCFPNELSLLASILYMGEDEASIVVKYPYVKKAVQNVIRIGSNMSLIEVLRDFNGWSWNINVRELQNIKYNMLYQSMLLVYGERLLRINLKDVEKDNFLMQKNKKEFTEFFDILSNVSMNLYIEENQDAKAEYEKVLDEKNQRLNLLNNKKQFVEQITEEKKECLKDIENLDKILNNADLLKTEYEKRNSVLPNKQKIFSISHLVDRLEKERESLLKQIKICNQIVQPREFVKEKTKISDELEFLNKKEDIINVCKECLQIAKQQIENAQEKEEIIKWIYKIRYYRYVPFNEKSYLKDVVKLKKDFEEVIKLIIKKAQEFKVWDVFTEDDKLTYIIIQELFNSKMINFKNVNISCNYEDGVLYVEYYDDNILEFKSQFKVDNVRIKKKIKLFI